MTELELRSAPIPSIKRLPLYLRFLKARAEFGMASVSCTHIAQDMGTDPTQVRKDLAITGIVGRPKVGYDVEELIDAIETFLGWKDASDAFLVGAGHLGTALMGYQKLGSHGLRIVAAFDVDPAKIGTQIHGRKVLPTRDLPRLAHRMHLHIGVITTPDAGAQAAADLLVTAGILAIWNFTSVRLDVPPNVIVENADLTSGLAVLSSNLKAMLGLRETPAQRSLTP